MAQPTVRDVRPVDPVLTSLSIGFRNESFIWDQLAPVVETPEQSGTYFIWDRDFWFRAFGDAGGAKRAAEGPYKRLGYSPTTATFKALERGFEKLTGDVTRNASQTPESLPQVDVQFLTNQMQMEYEAATAAALFITGIWGTSSTLTGGNQWSDYANSNPLADSDLAKRVVRRNTGATPNKLIVGAETFDDLKNHPLLLDKYKHTQTGILTVDLVAAALEIDNLIVGTASENTAAEGASFSGSDLWTDNALFLVTTETPGLMVPNGAYTFVWNERGNVPWAVETYREEQTRGDVTRVFTHFDQKVTSAQHGYIYLDTAA